MIVVAYISKLNIGFLALAVAIILARFGGIKDSVMYGGINLNVFWTLLGIYLFGQCMTQSGTLALFAKKLITKLPVRAEIWPIVCFVFTMLFALLGPTTILALTVVPLITIEIAGYIGANVECSMILTMFGGIAGRMTPLGGNLAGQIAVAEGEGFVETAVLSKVFFFAFIIFYAFTQWHIGFVAIIFSVIMVAAGCVDQKDVIDKTKWGTVVMVAGTGILASVVQGLGGITILSNFIGYASNIPLVTGIYGAASSVLSTSTGSYSAPFLLLLVFSVISFGLNLSIRYG